jgi:hypothetical protein
MITISPYPHGKRFAMTFVDDTDYSTRENTEPVYQLLGDHGFWGTKTVWTSRAQRTSSFRQDAEQASVEEGSGATLEDPEYADFICRLRDQGFEIALHGVAAGNSRREEVIEGLARFKAIVGYGPSLNAFHRTNLENLYCGSRKLDSKLFRMLEWLTDRSAYQGHVEGTPSFWGDIAHDTLRYVRLPFHTIDEINTLRVNPSMPFADPRRPYVRRWFAASDGADVLRFNRLLSSRNLDALERQGGVCVVYTHFAKAFAVPAPGGYRLDGQFVSTVKEVTGRRGCWFATATTLLDRLAAAKAVSVVHEGPSIRIGYAGDRPIEGLVLRVPSGLELTDATGQPVQVRTDHAVVLPTLQPGSRLQLRANREGQQVVEADPERQISLREHRRIEYFNYIGLLRGGLRDRAHYRAARQRSRASPAIQA